jgi:hypothetical protein
MPAAYTRVAAQAEDLFVTGALALFDHAGTDPPDEGWNQKRASTIM